MGYTENKNNLTHQINVIMERIHYAEGRRNNFVIIATALMAASVTLLTFTIKDLTLIYNFGLFSIAICFMILSLLIWILYSRQTNFYPFTDFTRNNKWFYRNTLEHENKFNVSIFNCIFARIKIKKNVGEEFKKQFNFYKNNSDTYLSSESKDLEADQNQIYILHVNEKYKNLYLTHLRKLTSIGLIVSLIISLLITICFHIFFTKEFLVKEFDFKDNKISAKLIIRKTNYIRSYSNGSVELEYLCNLHIVNNDNSTKKINELKLYDSFNMILPFTMTKNITANIQPKAIEDMVFKIWIDDNLSQDINNFKIK